MTRSVYVIGGAGTGKSTFMKQLLERTGWSLGSLKDLHATPNARGSLVTLRGHTMYNRNHSVGVYLGVMRDQFPGSDGLDRASSITGEQWLILHGNELPDRIIGEGATLATRRFLYGLHEYTELLVIALRCDPVVHDLRLLARGSGQQGSFVTSTVTKTENLARDLEGIGAKVMWVDSDHDWNWTYGLEAAEGHLAA